MRKLTSEEVLELVRAELIFQENFSCDHLFDKVRAKINYIENINKKNRFSLWIDRNQSSMWFFILLTSFAFAAKVLIENYLYK